MRESTTIARLAAAGTMLAVSASAALAHPGHEHTFSFASGFEHPLTGPDHVLAMVAVGLWAGLVGGRAFWAWPVAFVATMLAGGGLGLAGIALPLVEPGILASVIILGLLVAAAVRMPVVAGAALIAVFALLHGHAHGAEVPAGGGSALGYMAGFAIATALLHAAGLCIAYIGSTGAGRLAVRGAGVLVAVAGLTLALLGGGAA